MTDRTPVRERLLKAVAELCCAEGVGATIVHFHTEVSRIDA